MVKNNYMNFCFDKKWVFLFLLFILFGICLYPEKPANLLTNPDQFVVAGSPDSKVPMRFLTRQYVQLRSSVLNSEMSYVYRNWTPSEGIGFLEIQSGSFTPTKYMSVIVTGTNRTASELVNAYIECETNGHHIDIFKGSLNTNVSEAIVITPVNWCADKAHLKFTTHEHSTYVGVGSVYEISFFSYLKQTFIGKLAYYFAALAIFSSVMLAGASIALRYNWTNDPLPFAFVALAILSLFAFYIASSVLVQRRWIGFILIVIVVIFLLGKSGAEACKKAMVHLVPYFNVWAVISLMYFALLTLGYTGLNHWEPNYRFWPASWSSDAELPWLFTEAVRRGWNLKELFGGLWLPTDRPPLMSSSLFLLSDVFNLLQINNDGNYLHGSIYNAASIILNTLWAPAIFWLLTKFSRDLSEQQSVLIVLFIACLPFAIFNSIYGWPKSYGAAFALIACGLVWKCREDFSSPIDKASIVLFPIVCACSMLAHMSGTIFLAPLGVLYLLWIFRARSFTPMIVGSICALCILLTWNIYKIVVLPSADPVTKYALTGSFGFGDSSTLWQLLIARYKSMSFAQWLEIKSIMFQQVFIPINHSITGISLNSDYGAGFIDKLRAWDFMLLSKGNAGVIIFSIVGLCIIVRDKIKSSKNDLATLDLFALLLTVSVIAWLFIVVFFIAPAVLHHWPQAAIFGLALGGGVLTQRNYPLFFKAILIATITYTGMVWIISPLQHSLSIDVGAGVTLIALSAIMISKCGNKESK